MRHSPVHCYRMFAGCAWIFPMNVHVFLAAIALYAFPICINKKSYRKTLKFLCPSSVL